MRQQQWHQDCLELYNQGLSGRKIAEELGRGKSQVNDYLKWWRENEVEQVEEESPNTKPIIQPTFEMSNRDIYPIVTTDKITPNSTHLLIPDTQCKPDEDMSYLSWVGKYIVDKKPEVIVHIGDHADMPSLSSYDKGKKSAEGRRVYHDIDAAIEGMNVLLKPLWELQQQELSEYGEVRYKPKMVLTMGNHECLHPDTEVLTKDGFKLITEVTEDDTVLTMNENGTKSWNSPDLVFSKPFEGDLYEWSGRTFDVSCTPNHRMYYQTSGRKTAVKEAKDMLGNFSTINAVSSGDVDFDMSDDVIQLAAWLCTDSHHKGNRVYLYQRESNSHKIRDLLDKLEITYREYQRQRNITEICGKELKGKSQVAVEFHIDKSELEMCNTHSNKVLPEWVDNLSDRQFELFLDVVVDADGTIPTGAKDSVVVYGAKRFCDQVQAACVAHGYSASLTEYRPTHWRVNIYKRSVRKQEGIKPSLVPYNGLVYCMEIENSNFFIRRNNKVHLTGNCRIMRHVEANPELEGFLSYDNLRYKEFGWEVYDFLEPAILNGVVYCHFMPNPMTGKPYGGAALNILKQVGESFCMGHKQTLDVATRFLPASGKQQWAIIAGACYSHDEGYKGYQGNKHWRGIVVKHNVRQGTFNPMFIDLNYLQSRYG